jgi:hypothetical protein
VGSERLVRWELEALKLVAGGELDAGKLDAGKLDAGRKLGAGWEHQVVDSAVELEFAAGKLDSQELSPLPQ